MMYRTLGAAVALLACTAVAIAEGEQDRGSPIYLFPDLIPYVDRTDSYLVDWQLNSSTNQIRIGTVFANVGDGLFQIRQDDAGAGGAETQITQRVFIDNDNGSNYEDFPVNTAVNFHNSHNHLHFEDFAEFALLEASQINDEWSVGPVVSATSKTSYYLVHSLRIPWPEFTGAPPYNSSNQGLYQNVSRGWGDYYSHGLDGQYIDVAGVPDGMYWLRQWVDPTDVILETDETNNQAYLLIDLSQPGQAIRRPDGSFIQPGDFLPSTPGDLDNDEDVDMDDWVRFRDSGSISLSGLSDSEAYGFGDLNLDRVHSPADFLLFKGFYDGLNGSGAFAMDTGVPEPTAVMLLLAAVAGLLVRRPT